ncbi:aminotransferase [Sandarakinorhabdus sp.]|uniref:aminotransferase n=1 Tax=Sandarakinorhabdus sp. TaxID=1916663 RepID=UPI003F72FBDC
MRNYDIDELRRLDVAHHLPPQADFAEIVALGGSRVITRAQGVTIEDGDGNRILDAMAGLWCVQVGYGRAELAEAAHAQMLELPYYNGFFKTATPPAITLAAKVAELTDYKLPHVFFSNSGSEAMDTAMRMIRRYWDIKGEPGRTQFIARTNGYHGTTIGSMSLGGMARMHAQGPRLEGIHHVRQPYGFGEAEGLDDAAFIAALADDLEARIAAVGAHNIAAFVAEPVQGAGGVIIPPAGYWDAIVPIVRRHGILLVMDEVICGFGRLGKWFGHQHFGISPDIITMAKGISSGYLPISATAVTAKIAETLRTGGEFVHGFTYSGHPVAAAVALANIAIMERENLVAGVANDLAPYLASALARLKPHPLVGEVRSIGLLGAVEIVADKADNRRFGPSPGTAGPIVRDAAIARGVMVRAVYDRLVMCPPLIITHAQIDLIVERLGQALEDAAPALAALA